MRRRAPAAVALVAAALTSALFLLTAGGPGWMVAAADGTAMEAAGIFLPLPVAFALALLLPRWAALAAVVLLMAALQVSGGFNPFLIAIPGGAWIVGFILRDRSRLTADLERSARRLRAETELLAEESVRYERARIARELHDIVAHCVSVMVVQAYAGERLVEREPERAAESFDHILDAANQAKLELHRLVELLDGDVTGGVPAGRLSVALRELRDRVVAAGLTVELGVSGDIDDVPAPVSGAVLRAVQEGVTNAVKHGAGAPIRIEVERSSGWLRAAVANGPAAGPADPATPMLRRSGGGYGLEGMRERLEALGGTLAAGPEADGGWAVEARLPSVRNRVTSTV